MSASATAATLPSVSASGDDPSPPAPEAPPRPRLELVPVEGTERVEIRAVDEFDTWRTEQVLSTALRDWRLANRFPV